MPVAALVLMLPVVPAPAPAADYLLVFSADGTPYRPTHAHTFAAVARVETAPDGTPRLADLRSLSWLPAAGRVRGLALRPEAGRNVPLDETLRDAVAAGRRVCLWGPYRLRPEMADAFRARVELVERSFRYKGACLLSRPDVCDCTRSIEELVGSRRYIGVYGYGAAASSHVVRLYGPWLVGPAQAHPWVATLAGLDDYPLVRRAYGDFTSKADQRAAARGR